MIKILYSILFILIITLFIGCNEPSSESENYATIDEVNMKEPVKKLKNVYFMMPSMVETFDIFKEEGDYISVDDLSPIGISKTTPERSMQSLILGMYSVDLLFTTLYENSQASINYLKHINLLSSKLGLENLIPLDKIKNSEMYLSNQDSLNDFVGKMLYEVDSYLKENENGHLAALLMLGGWIESIYLAQIAYQRTNNKETIELKLVEQKDALEILTGLLSSYEKIKHLKIIKTMNEIKEIYDKITVNVTSKNQNTSPISLDTNEEGIVIIGGEEDVLEYTLDDIEAIFKKVNTIRNEIIN